MAVFLSDEWVRELDAAARTSGDSSELAGASLIVEQRVTGAPCGDARFHLVLGARGVRAHPGPAPRADLTITTDYETAVALQRGEMNAQHALVAGTMRLRGDVGHLVRRGDTLAALGDVFASVRETTTLAGVECDRPEHH